MNNKNISEFPVWICNNCSSEFCNEDPYMIVDKNNSGDCDKICHECLSINTLINIGYKEYEPTNIQDLKIILEWWNKYAAMLHKKISKKNYDRLWTIADIVQEILKDNDT